MIDLERYLIPAMEAVNQSNFNAVFADRDYMRYKSNTAKVKGKTYDLSNYKYLKSVIRTVLQDKWSEADFIKFIEENIDYNGKGLEIYYWAEDENTDPLSERDKRNKKLWESLKLICVSEDGSGNTLFYSKSRHGFYFINHESTREENMRNFIKWTDALQGFITYRMGGVKWLTPADYEKNPEKYKDKVF